MQGPTTPTPAAKTHKPFYRRLGFWVTVLIIEIIIIFFQHFGHHKNIKQTNALPVVITNATTSDVPVYLTALGSVAPTSNVTVRTQVSGQLISVLFKEGQMVKKGDLLAEIDPRPYEAQLQQYEGQLARDQALLANSKLDLTRYQTLWKQNSVAKQTLDTQLSVVAQDEGNVQLDEGLIQTVKVNLIYTKITAPIDGRVGLRLVDPGNFVQPSDTSGIVVINTLNPINVVFTLSEDHIPAVLKEMDTGKTLTVQAYNRTQKKLIATGRLLTMDNQIDPTTGTVKLKAVFDNANNALFPDQFVNVQLLLETLKNAVIVPTAAIQHGTQGTFVFVFNPNKNIVNTQAVETGVTMGENTVVTNGLSSGQSVVVEGADKLTDGAAVTATPLTSSAPVTRQDAP